MRRDIEATVRFLSTAEGGRRSAARSGYRPQFSYDGHDWDAVHEYPDQDEVSPGATARVYLTFLTPAAHVGRVVPGLRFQLREGRRVVGEGEVVRILELEASAREAADVGGTTRGSGARRSE